MRRFLVALSLPSTPLRARRLVSLTPSALIALCCACFYVCCACFYVCLLLAGLFLASFPLVPAPRTPCFSRTHFGVIELCLLAVDGTQQALQQQMLIQHEQQQQEIAIVLAQQQHEQQQQSLMLNVPECFPYHGGGTVPGAPSQSPSAAAAAAAVSAEAEPVAVVAGRSLRLWAPFGGVGVPAAGAGAATGLVASSMPMQQRHYQGFTAPISSPSPVFPPGGMQVGSGGGVMIGGLPAGLPLSLIHI